MSMKTWMHFSECKLRNWSFVAKLTLVMFLLMFPICWMFLDAPFGTWSHNAQAIDLPRRRDFWLPGPKGIWKWCRPPIWNEVCQATKDVSNIGWCWRIGWGRTEAAIGFSNHGTPPYLHILFRLFRNWRCMIDTAPVTNDQNTPLGTWPCCWQSN